MPSEEKVIKLSQAKTLYNDLRDRIEDTVTNQQNLIKKDTIAYSETNNTATKNYSIGDLFVMNGKLYKATAAIAQDGAIITEGNGQNCEEVSVDSEFARSSDIPAVPVQDVQVDGTSIINNNIANIPIATSTNKLGLVKVISPGNIGVSTDGTLLLDTAGINDLKAGTNEFKSVTANVLHTATFYGLAKAAGDTTQASSSNPVGTYTDNAKTAIQTMLDVPSNADVQQAIANVNTMKIHICTSSEYNAETNIPTVSQPDTQTLYLVPNGQGNNLFVEWAYVNNAWERFGSADIDLSNYVQKDDYATSSDAGVVKTSTTYGIMMSSNGEIQTARAGSDVVKTGSDQYRPIVPYNQHQSSFYGLAKAAGDTTQAQSANSIGVYTDTAKAKIQNMLNVPSTNAIASLETNNTATKNYSIGDLFIMDGKLYKATAVIAQNSAIVTEGNEQNCEEVSVADEFVKNSELPKKGSHAPSIVKSTSDDVVSFTDGADGWPVESLMVNVEPVQDLHGYENPWPAGGGVNLFDIEKATLSPGAYGFSMSRVGDKITISGTATGNGPLSFAVTTTYADDSLSGKGYICQVFEWTGNKTFGACWGFRTENERAFAISIIDVAVGDSVNVSFKISVAETSQSAYAPYSNICPISGWTGAKVTRTGKNLLHLVESEMVSRGWNRFFPNPITKPGTYTLSVVNIFGGTSNMGASIIFTASDSDATLVGNILTGYNFGQTGGETRTATVNEEQANSPFICFRCSSAGTTFESIVNAQIQIELGSTATSYEPYQGNTYSVNWETEAGTVYGGTLDVTNGTLTVDRAMVDLGTLDWTYNSSQLSMVSQNLSGTVGDGANVICSKYKTETNLQGAIWANVDKAVAINKANCTTTGNFAIGVLVVKDTDYTDAATFKTAMSGVQLVYELATPVTYTLTPQEVTTLLGANNIWADTGDTSVDYCADTKKYVDESIPAVPVQDIRVNGTSILSNGVANVKIKASTPLEFTSANGLSVATPGNADVKSGSTWTKALTPELQHASAFYGLAKAAGDSTQSASNNPIGNYTESAKSAISQMLNAPVTVSGTTPTITAKAGVQYVCGEVSTLTIVVPASGCIDVIFESGSMQTVLTVTPPAGKTMKWPDWFDPDSLEANAVYEINILNGVYGAVSVWM